MSYNIRGQADPAYIANVIATWEPERKEAIRD
jgi:hypothetical protein